MKTWAHFVPIMVEVILLTIHQLIEDLRNSRDVRETRFGDVTAFNFTKSAFYHGHWNETTMKARSLFIDTRQETIVARGYDKFFNYGENELVTEDALKAKLKFPLSVYRKENGFLGLIAWNSAKDDFSFFTKSRMDEGPYAEELKRLFYSSVDLVAAKNVTKHMGMTMIVECISPMFDPHIIEYKKPELVLLDLITNDLDGRRVNYFTMKNYWAPRLKIRAKEFVGFITNFDELKSDAATVSDKDFVTDNKAAGPTEGYVIEDRSGYMLKLKTGYYLKWKRYRRASDMVLAGKMEPGNDPFLIWCIANADRYELAGKSIIEKRKLYELER